MLLHPIGELKSQRFDFNSNKTPIEIITALRHDDYKIYQFILHDSRYIMETWELDKRSVKYKLFDRVVTAWFGLKKKIVYDILIYPDQDFDYPYSFGNYIYLYTKQTLDVQLFENWILDQFPKRLSDIDDTHVGLNKDFIELINDTDYLLITNYDVQSEFGVISNANMKDTLIELTNNMELYNLNEVEWN